MACGMQLASYRVDTSPARVLSGSLPSATTRLTRSAAVKIPFWEAIRASEGMCSMDVLAVKRCIVPGSQYLQPMLLVHQEGHILSLALHRARDITDGHGRWDRHGLGRPESRDAARVCLR
eukprot:scaffold1006_cov270-Pinguiococcus_pyrenoidosus.AAC.16